MENDRHIADLLVRTATLAESLEWIRGNMPLAADIEERVGKIEHSHTRRVYRIALVTGIVSGVLGAVVVIAISAVFHTL